jgi:hypothetical protein
VVLNFWAGGVVGQGANETSPMKTVYYEISHDLNQILLEAEVEFIDFIKKGLS